MVGGIAYNNLADAYAAANLLAIGPTPVAILVGMGSAADFGTLTLSANWNQYVYITGLSPNLSKLGEIATGGYTDPISLYGVSVNGVTGASVIKAKDCAFSASLANVGANSVFHNCLFLADVTDLAANGVQFFNCVFKTSGATINASTAKSIFLYNCLLSAEIGENVTPEGSYLVKNDLKIP